MNLVAAWLLNVALHGTVLLLLARGLDRAASRWRGAWRELLWRTALCGGVLTATLQLAVAHWPPRVTAATAAAVPAQVALGPSAGAADAPARRAAAAAAAPEPVSVPPARFATKYTLPRLPQALPAWLVAAWLAGLVIGLARIAASLLRLRHALARARSPQREDLRRDSEVLARRAGIAAPRVLVLDAIPSSLAATGRRIVLPAWALDTLQPAQRFAMLGHELAHIARRDPEWKLALALWRAVFWFLPCAAFAQRRLDELAELACDAHGAALAGDTRGLAECLAACAEQHRLPHRFALAAAMAARPSALLLRIERLLEGVAMDTAKPGARARLVALLVLTAAASALPAIAFDAGAAQAAAVASQDGGTTADALRDSRKHSSISIHSDDDGGRDTTTVSSSDDEHTFRADVEGKIGFDEAETDIVSLDADGSARLEETRGGVRQRIEVVAHGDKLERRYFVDGTEQPYAEQARALMAVAVKELLRTGIDAAARAKRLYARGGASGVLDEIDQIHSDYVRGLYLAALSRLATLAPRELDRALGLAGTMQSDYERRQALSALFARQTLDAARQVTFLHQLGAFGNDYERAELLVEVAPKLADSGAVRQAWLDAALGVHSDYERRRTLQAMLERGGLDDAQLGSVIEASATMQSDYEHRELLAAAARRLHDVDAVAAAYARSAQGIHSDYERREALLALIHAGKLGARSADAVLDSAAQIKSDYECREVLVALARVMPDDSAVVAHYRSVSSRLPEFERSAAESALAR